MIIVNVNDRLGTKAAIPCYASDPISQHRRLSSVTLGFANSFAELFKAQVAARIGREPHEILLKRQGERPFKDQLTLEDYGVSNGVQLDLSVTPSTFSPQAGADCCVEKSILAIKDYLHDHHEPSCVLENSGIYRRELPTGGICL